MSDLRGGPSRDRVSLATLMAFVAGIAVSLWLLMPVMREAGFGGTFNFFTPFFFIPIVVVLGGVSCVGVPLLLLERLRRRRDPAWGEGRTLWFATGIASWLLWPPIAMKRTFGASPNGISEPCYIYGTPLMALYMVWALWAGGRLRRSRRHRLCHRSWKERLGLTLGLLWACTGLYLLAWLYGIDSKR